MLRLVRLSKTRLPRVVWLEASHFMRGFLLHESAMAELYTSLHSREARETHVPQIGFVAGTTGHF